LKNGPSHLVITCGENGIKGFTRQEQMKVDSSQVRVIDTVGAGDTAGAIIAAAVAGGGLDSLYGDEFRAVLSLASRASAITCSRQGANSPTQNEYDDFWRN
jgi:fructokinase